MARILCVSPEIHSQLSRRGAPKRKLQDFPNAIDLGRFEPITGHERVAARRSLGLPESARVILHFGWSWQRKGGDLMVAAAELMATDPGVVALTVLGETGAASTAPRLIGHPVVRPLAPTDDVRRLYAAADVFLSTSTAEGMPFAVLEALACGLPVVATELPVLRELLDGLPGVATVAADPRAIAAGVAAVMALGDRERQQHAQLARGRIEASYALGPWARRLVDLYEQLVGARTDTA